MAVAAAGRGCLGARFAGDVDLDCLFFIGGRGIEVVGIADYGNLALDVGQCDDASFGYVLEQQLGDARLDVAHHIVVVIVIERVECVEVLREKLVGVLIKSEGYASYVDVYYLFHNSVVGLRGRESGLLFLNRYC